MTQENIIEIVKRRKVVFSKEIIEELCKTNNSSCENIKHSLKQMRKYKELGFVLVSFSNKKIIIKKHPHLCKKITEHDEKGFIRKPCYLYFINNKK